MSDLLKIDLYNSNYSYRHDFKHSKAKNLGLVYDNNMFVSLKYHRRSYRIIKGNQHIIHTNMSARGSLLSVEYKYSSSSKGIKHKNFMVVVDDALLVGRMLKLNFGNEMKTEG